MLRRALGFVWLVHLAWAPALARATPPVPDHPWPPAASAYQPAGTEIAPGLRIGDVLGAANADRAADLLPPEIAGHYRSGGYENPIVSWPNGIYHQERAYEEATRQNAGRYAIDPKTGTILVAATGKPAEDLYGTPFPSVENGDPQAGIKALWNQFYTYWHQGSVRAETLIVWTNPSGVDRISTNDVNYQPGTGSSPGRASCSTPTAWRASSTILRPATTPATSSGCGRRRSPGSAPRTSR
jgi:hypothetical protein